MFFTVVGLGEVLWDLLPSGPQLGGAPANFAYQAGALGARAIVVTRVGNDDLGRQVIERFEEMNLPSETVQIDPLRRTGTVSVSLNENGIAKYAFADDAAWEQLQATPGAMQVVRGAHAVCFGTLGQRSAISRKAIEELVTATPAEALKIFDVNLRLNCYSPELIEQSMYLANVLKVNDEELQVLAAMFSLQGAVRNRIERLARLFGFRTIVLTSGALGSLIHQDGRWSEVPPQQVQVADTVGAGDAFAAALTMGLLSGKDLSEIHAVAAEIAGYVCSRPGGTPPMPEVFRRKLGGQLGEFR